MSADDEVTGLRGGVACAVCFAAEPAETAEMFIVTRRTPASVTISQVHARCLPDAIAQGWEGRA